MRKIIKILSVILTLAIFIGVFSTATPVWAAEIQQAEEITATLQSETENAENNDQSDLVSEIIGKRDRFTKYFDNNDGTQTAVISSTPVHYEKDGKWVDIDNTLVSTEDGDIQVYENKSNSFVANIPQDLSADSTVKLEKDGYTISFELQGSDIFESKKNSKGKVKVKDKDTKADPENSFLDKNEAVVFENVGEYTDVEYAVTSTGIKENIVLNKKPKSEVTYEYTITANGLQGQLNSDSSISFKSDNGDEIFNIPSPVMYDADGITSDNIDVTFSQSDNGYLLTYTPSYEWLKNEAKYPVVVDPVIESTSECGIIDTYVDSSTPTVNYGSEELVETYKGGTTTLTSYFNIRDSYIFNSDIKIKSAILAVNYYIGIFTDDCVEIGAYPITSAWSESTVTYNTKPSLGELVDKETFTSSAIKGYKFFDVTKAFTLEDDVYGIALQQTDDVLGSALLAFNSSEYEAEADKQPYFTIEFYESQGIEEQYDYHAFDAGRAGKVYFNDFTSQIYIERDELGLSGINMPVQIKRYYNSGWGGTYSGNYIIKNTLFATNGYGWETNYNQFLEHHDNIDGTENILYYNAQGQITYFEKTSTEVDGKCKWTEKADKFSNTDGYTLWVDTSVNDTVEDNLNMVTIEDSGGQIYEFNEDGLLTKINSAEEDSTACITVSYTPVTISGITYTDIIDTVTDGAGRKFKFSYTTYSDFPFPLLTSIQAYTASGNAIKVTDDSGEEVNYRITYTYSIQEMYDSTVPILTSATYPDGESVYYTVGEITSTVQNIDGYTVQFYNYDNAVGISELVYTEDSDTPVNGGELKIIISNGNLHERAYWDPNVTIQTKQFDLYGRVINVINSDGTTAPRTYSDDLTAQGEITYGLYVDYEYDTETEGQNLVTNGSFENSTTGWEIYNGDNVVRVTDADCNDESETPGSLRITGQQDGVNYATQIIEVADGLSGDRYLLDYFVKNNKNSHNALEMFEISTVLIEARDSSSTESTWETVLFAEINPFNTNWQNYRHSFDIDFDYDEIRITLAYYFQYGRIWFDDVSLVNTYKETADSSSDSEESAPSDDDTSETDECTCDGCTQPGCDCRDCSDNCTRVSCNASYSFGNDSNGSWFTITDGTKEMSMTQTVEGNYYSGQSDINGIETDYNYNQANGQLETMTDGNGKVTSYTYDAMSRLNGVSKTISGLSNSQKMTTSYNYEDDRVDSITHNGFSYNYEYDVWGNVTSVKVGEQSLVSYGYGENENRSRPNRITYGNGDYTDYVFSDDGTVTSLKSYSAENALLADYEYTYGEYGEVTKIKNNTENTVISDLDGQTQIILLNGEGEEDDTVLYSTGLNENGETIEILGGMSYTKTNGATSTDGSTGITTSGSGIVTPSNEYTFGYTSDYFGRQTKKTMTTETDVSQYLNFETQYKYKDIGMTETTSLVSSYRTVLNTVTENPDDETSSTTTVCDWEYIYSYDSNGNIIDVSVTLIDGDAVADNVSICSYTYDEAGQLVRENNMYFERSYTYVYDKGGNIAQKSEYEYSTGELGEAISTVNYTYDSVWKDKLTAYGDTAITTDAMGNPLNMVGSSFLDDAYSGTLEWNGRQLRSVTVDGIKYEYTYDTNGLRTRMVIYNKDGVSVNGIYYYIWQNGQLTGYCITDPEGNIEHTVKMLFDSNGDSIGYELYAAEDNSCETFFFHKNLQGDITNVFNESGKQVISYIYDAWGNISVDLEYRNNEELNEASRAAIYTPITYRGYMYDPYSGLYYLQSRYYNPTYGRFLNADSIMQTGKPLGANIFAYCGNNPVNFVDYKGLYSKKKYSDALVLIGKYARIIVREADRFGVDPVVVAGVIVTEQTLHVNFIDSITDKLLYFADTSLGIGQVRISTAKEVEENMPIKPIVETAFVFMNMTVWSVPEIGFVAGSYEYALACRLEDDEQNIMYVAAYIAYIQEYWLNAGYDISEKPGILASLYNKGLGEPKENPQPTPFGSFVAEHYDEIAIILAFGIIFDILFNGG